MRFFFFVHLSLETPLMVDYSAGVPGSSLLIDGHMRLKVRALAAEGFFCYTLFFLSA
jgi:hypothetical protein